MQKRLVNLFLIIVLIFIFAYPVMAPELLGGGLVLDFDPSCRQVCGIPSEEFVPLTGYGCGFSIGQPTVCDCGSRESKPCPSGSYCWPNYWWCAATELIAKEQYCTEYQGGYWQDSIEECYECETNAHCPAGESCAYSESGKICDSYEASEDHCTAYGWSWLRIPATVIDGCFKPCLSVSDCSEGQSCALMDGEKVCANPEVSSAHCTSAGGIYTAGTFGGLGTCDFACGAVGWTSACGCTSDNTACKDTSVLGSCVLGGSTPCPLGWYCIENVAGEGTCGAPVTGEEFCQAAGYHWDSGVCCEAEGYNWDSNLGGCCETMGGEWDTEGDYWADEICLFQRSISPCYNDPDFGNYETFIKNGISYADIVIKAPHASIINENELMQLVEAALSSGDKGIEPYIVSAVETPAEVMGSPMEDFCINDPPQWAVDMGLIDALPGGVDIVELTCAEGFKPTECRWNGICSDGACEIVQGKCLVDGDCPAGQTCINENCDSGAGPLSDCQPQIFPVAKIQDSGDTLILKNLLDEDIPKDSQGDPMVGYGTEVWLLAAGGSDCEGQLGWMTSIDGGYDYEVQVTEIPEEDIKYVYAGDIVTPNTKEKMKIDVTISDVINTVQFTACDLKLSDPECEGVRKIECKETTDCALGVCVSGFCKECDTDAQCGTGKCLLNKCVESIIDGGDLGNDFVEEGSAEEFPIFDNWNIFLVMLMLVSYYFYKSKN